MGYYQNNEYPEGSEERRLWEEKLETKEKITSVDIPKVVRNILADKPKVTRFNIKWYGFLEWLWADDRDNADGDDIEYPPPQPLDGEIDRMMETDNPDFVITSDAAVPHNETLVESSKHPASDPAGARVEDAEDIEEIGSEDDEEEEEEDDGEISLEEEDLDEEEEIDGDEDEEMQDAEMADEDTTMQSIEDHGHSNQSIAQTS